MKRSLLAGAIIVALAAPAFAQTTVIEESTGRAPGASVTIEPEYRTRIRTYVRERSIPTVRVRERIRVGATLPEDIELREVPDDWGPGVRRYRYVYAGDDIVFVEPGTRRVVHVLD